MIPRKPPQNQVLGKRIRHDPTGAHQVYMPVNIRPPPARHSESPQPLRYNEPRPNETDRKKLDEPLVTNWIVNASKGVSPIGALFHLIERFISDFTMLHASLCMQRFASFVRNEESNHGAEKSAALKKTIMANPIFKILIHRTEEGIPRDPIQLADIVRIATASACFGLVHLTVLASDAMLRLGLSRFEEIDISKVISAVMAVGLKDPRLIAVAHTECPNAVQKAINFTVTKAAERGKPEEILRLVAGYVDLFNPFNMATTIHRLSYPLMQESTQELDWSISDPRFFLVVEMVEKMLRERRFICKELAMISYAASFLAEFSPAKMQRIIQGCVQGLLARTQWELDQRDVLYLIFSILKTELPMPVKQHVIKMLSEPYPEWVSGGMNWTVTSMLKSDKGSGELFQLWDGLKALLGPRMVCLILHGIVKKSINITEENLGSVLKTDVEPRERPENRLLADERTQGMIRLLIDTVSSGGFDAVHTALTECLWVASRIGGTPLGLEFLEVLMVTVSKVFDTDVAAVMDRETMLFSFWWLCEKGTSPSDYQFLAPLWTELVDARTKLSTAALSSLMYAFATARVLQDSSGFESVVEEVIAKKLDSASATSLCKILCACSTVGYTYSYTSSQVFFSSILEKSKGKIEDFGAVGLAKLVHAITLTKLQKDPYCHGVVHRSLMDMAANRFSEVELPEGQRGRVAQMLLLKSLAHANVINSRLYLSVGRAVAAAPKAYGRDLLVELLWSFAVADTLSCSFNQGEMEQIVAVFGELKESRLSVGQQVKLYFSFLLYKLSVSAASVSNMSSGNSSNSVMTNGSSVSAAQMSDCSSCSSAATQPSVIEGHEGHPPLMPYDALLSYTKEIYLKQDASASPKSHESVVSTVAYLSEILESSKVAHSTDAQVLYGEFPMGRVGIRLGDGKCISVRGPDELLRDMESKDAVHDGASVLKTKIFEKAGIQLIEVTPWDLQKPDAVTYIAQKLGIVIPLSLQKQVDTRTTSGSRERTSRSSEGQTLLHKILEAERPEQILKMVSQSFATVDAEGTAAALHKLALMGGSKGFIKDEEFGQLMRKAIGFVKNGKASEHAIAEVMWASARMGVKDAEVVAKEAVKALNSSGLKSCTREDMVKLIWALLWVGGEEAQDFCLRVVKIDGRAFNQAYGHFLKGVETGTMDVSFLMKVVRRHSQDLDLFSALSTLVGISRCSDRGVAWIDRMKGDKSFVRLMDRLEVLICDSSLVRDAEMITSILAAAKVLGLQESSLVSASIERAVKLRLESFQQRGLVLLLWSCTVGTKSMPKREAVREVIKQKFHPQLLTGLDAVILGATDRKDWRGILSLWDFAHDFMSDELVAAALYQLGMMSRLGLSEEDDKELRADKRLRKMVTFIKESIRNGTGWEADALSDIMNTISILRVADSDLVEQCLKHIRRIGIEGFNDQQLSYVLWCCLVSDCRRFRSIINDAVANRFVCVDKAIGWSLKWASKSEVSPAEKVLTFIDEFLDLFTPSVAVIAVERLAKSVRVLSQEKIKDLMNTPALASLLVRLRDDITKGEIDAREIAAIRSAAADLGLPEFMFAKVST